MFAADDDDNAEFWTVRHTLASLLGYWLYGVAVSRRPIHGST